METSQIKRPGEKSLVLYKSFNTLWSERPTLKSCMISFLHLRLYCCIDDGVRPVRRMAGEVKGGEGGGGTKEGTEKGAVKVHRKRNRKGDYAFLQPFGIGSIILYILPMLTATSLSSLLVFLRHGMARRRMV